MRRSEPDDDDARVPLRRSRDSQRYGYETRLDRGEVEEEPTPRTRPNRVGEKHESHKRHEPTIRGLDAALRDGSSAIFRECDGRTFWMRRYRDLRSGHIADLGGADALSMGQITLIERAAMLTLQLELMESRWEETDGVASSRQLDDYGKATGGLRRCLEALGLTAGRAMRNVTPDRSTSQVLAALRGADND